MSATSCRMGREIMGFRAKNWPRISWTRGSLVQAIEHRLSRMRGPTQATTLFCTTNGIGIGHLTRALAVATSWRRINPDRQIVFLISTPDLSVVRKSGFPVYYVPYFAEVEAQIGWQSWSDFVETTCRKIFYNHGVDLVVFDGYLPFKGLVKALARHPKIKRAWIRRGLENPHDAVFPDALEPKFDFIIRPQEAGARPSGMQGKSVLVDPIVAFDAHALPRREEARATLGIPDGALAVYVQLGSGVKVDNSAALEDVLRVLGEYPDLFVVSGMSILSYRDAPPVRRGVTIRNYPNYPHFRAFDFAVSAAGYNAVHEFLACETPTILVPRESPTETEDQLARAEIVAAAGAGVVVRTSNDRDAFRDQLRKAVERLRCADERIRFTQAAARLLPSTGALTAASFLDRFANGALQVQPDKPCSTPYVASLAELRDRALRDEPELRLLTTLIRPGSLALDIGADIGLYSLAMIEAGATVKAFECRPDAAEQLRRIFAGFPVEVFELAAGKSNGPADLFLPIHADRPLGARASLRAVANCGYSQIRYVVRQGRIDDYEFSPVSFLKIDVEGHEKSALLGARRTIERNRPVIMVEIEERHHPGESRDVFALLEDLGYESFYFQHGILNPAGHFDFAAHQRPENAKAPDERRNPAYINNFLFIPPERLEQVLEDIAGLASGRVPA